MTECTISRAQTQLKRSWRILLIEDNPADRILTAGILKAYDALTQIVDAETGAEALAALARTDGPSFDCILLDLRLPDMDGKELLARMAAINSAAKAPPVIVLTGTGSEHLGDELIREGAQDYLLKETIEFSLCRTIRYAIERQDHLKLEFANQVRSKMIGMLSSDMRDPLTSILLLSKVLAEKKDEEFTSDDREFAQTIRSCAEAVALAVDEILAAARRPA